MVIKKSHIISTALFLSIITAPAVIGDDSNSLVQLDLKKTSGDSVDVTLVTSNTYGDNVLVRKKSDNKYVILIPKVQSSGFSASNLSGVRDLVSDVDVKTINDTTGGYTKVTLITTKPLDIKTKTVKSTPLTSEQKEYNTLIAQANAIKNTVTKDAPKIREQKTEVTVGKVSEQKIQPKQEKQPAKTETKQIEPKKTEAKKADIKLAEITPKNIEKQNRHAHLAELINEAKQEKALEEIPDVAPSVPEPIVNNEIQDIENLVPQETKKVSSISIKSILSKIKHKIPSKLPKALGIILLSGFAITLISKRSKKEILNNNYDLQTQDKTDNTTITENIINDNELSWKEKYQLYIDKSAAPVARANNKGNYSFIKRPSKQAIEAKREELEKMITPQDAFEIVENENLYSEDSTISKTIKFKAFENNTNTLSMAKRGRQHRSRFKKYETEIPLREQKTINLEDSPLSSNPRSLKDANLKVTDVDKKRLKYQPKEYIMSSVDEYLNILDNETKPSVTNPIAKSKENNYFKGSVVKSGYKIDSNKGFYIVNKDGKNKLVGKVNDKVFVLKDFDRNISNPIQVRHDNANVYMVKTDGFKSLVEVDNDKMGVLIEL